MKRVQFGESSSNPNFIGAWQVEPTLFCDQLIDYFESNKSQQRKGVSGGGIDKEVKSSTDIAIKPKQLSEPGHEVFNRYFDSLFDCYKDYLEQWPFLQDLSDNLEIGVFNLQKYIKGQHFKRIHTERSGLESIHRVLVWMTYLNDVEDGGETFFSHYGLSIKPQRGLTLIWPAEWTHAHNGGVLNSDSKYIITGWITFSK